MGSSEHHSVGYYRFEIIAYDIVDYGHKNNVWVNDRITGTKDFILYLLGTNKLKDFGITML